MKFYPNYNYLDKINKHQNNLKDKDSMIFTPLHLDLLVLYRSQHDIDMTAMSSSYPRQVGVDGSGQRLVTRSTYGKLPNHFPYGWVIK